MWDVCKRLSIKLYTKSFHCFPSLYELLNNKITSVKHVCHFGSIKLTSPPSLCVYFMDASSCLADLTLYFLVSCHWYIISTWECSLRKLAIFQRGLVRGTFWVHGISWPLFCPGKFNKLHSIQDVCNEENVYENY